jgi:selenocysteine-specific elongation factor
VTTLVVTTAGHVDHGKSTLVRALTGTDPDRLPEERRRGLTIELGFARIPLPGGDEVHFIDVPGHERFVGTMLAGVGAVDACLVVVAATEGWRAQTEEHLRILELLGVRRGLVAVTMSELVDRDTLDGAVAGIAARTVGTFLGGAPVLCTDSVTGRGLDQLVAALADLPPRSATDDRRSRVRMWIDRSFSIAGAGTVVTGTLTGGPLTTGDTVHLVTRRGVRPARVRGLESFGEPAGSLDPGRRAAVNLAGVDHTDLRRGDALVEPHRWHLTENLDASLHVLTAADRPVQRAGAHVLHVGSDEQPVRLQVLGGRAIEPGGLGAVRLRLARSLPLLPGDRFVLRDAGTSTTVGGGEVLDVDPVLRPSQAAPDRDVRRVVGERGWIDADELERITGTNLPPTLGRWVVDPIALHSARHELSSEVDEAGPAGLDVARLDERQRAIAASDVDLEVRHGLIRRRSSADPLTDHPYVAALAKDPYHPPSPSEAGASDADARELVRRGVVVREAGVHFSRDAIDGAARAAAELLDRNPQGFTVADLRAHLGTTRRFALPLLARLDRDGVTRRRGDLRIAGPRLPAGREG